MEHSTQPSTIPWERLQSPETERTLLQRITPLHMGAVIVVVLVMMIVSSGPATMSTVPTQLPALATGGGSGVETIPTMAGATVVAAAQPASATRKATPRASGTRLRGIPSPAAAANLAIARGTRAPAGSTGALQLRGIPSPAASAALGPQILPFTPSDGVTLPRSFSERDSHAVEANYGTGVLPMETPVELPAMTPGQAAANAEARVTRNQLTGDTSSAPVVTGGLIVAN